MRESKNKMVCFRISNADYETLEGLRATSGASSVSDFARSALLHAVRSGFPNNTLELADLVADSHLVERLLQASADTNTNLKRLCQLLEKRDSAQEAS